MWAPSIPTTASFSGGRHGGCPPCRRRRLRLGFGCCSRGCVCGCVRLACTHRFLPFPLRRSQAQREAEALAAAKAAVGAAERERERQWLAQPQRVVVDTERPWTATSSTYFMPPGEPKGAFVKMLQSNKTCLLSSYLGRGTLVPCRVCASPLIGHLPLPRRGGGRGAAASAARGQRRQPVHRPAQDHGGGGAQGGGAEGPAPHHAGRGAGAGNN